MEAPKGRSLTEINGKKVSKHGENVQPGDAIVIQCYFRLNNNHLHINDYDSYKRIMKRSTRFITIVDSETKEVD